MPPTSLKFYNSRRARFADIVGGYIAIITGFVWNDQSRRSLFIWLIIIRNEKEYRRRHNLNNAPLPKYTELIKQ